MSEIHYQASRSIQRQSQTLAQTIVTLYYKKLPNDQLRFSEDGLEKSIRDVTYHLTYLTQSLALDSPSLFIEYSEWCKILFLNMGFADDLLQTTFQCMRQVISEHLVEEQSVVACDFIDAALQHLPTVLVTLPSFIMPNAPLGNLAQAYLHALLHQDRALATQLILNAAEEGTNIRDIYLHVLQPCQRELGRLWHINQVSIGKEHYATAVTQSIMAQLYPYLFSNAPTVKKAAIVVACVSGELHELGARMLADFFEMEGWDSFFLGANTPAQGIIEMLHAHNAAILCLSVTMTINISQVADVIKLVRRSPKVGQTRVLVGGHPFNQIPDLWKQIGADGYASDAQSALSIASQLIVQEPLF